jgi:phage protein D
MPALSLSSAAPDGLRRPLTEITVGDESAERWTSYLLVCEAHCGLLPGVDRLRLTMAPGGPRPAIDDTGQVALGYEDSGAEAVFRGRVSVLRDEAQGTYRVLLTNGGHQLAMTRANQSFEQQSAGDVVSALAGAAGVDTATVEAGIDLPFLALDDRRSALDQVASLARRSGYVAYFDESDALHFCAPAEAPPVQTFRYGVDVLALTVLESPGPIGSITVVGEGAAGSQGQDAWSWLVKDPASVTGNAGDGDPARLRTDRRLRTADAAQAAADGLLAIGGLLQTTGELLAPGAPLARVGTVIEIADAPVDALNGEALVTGVAHRFDKGGGFTSRVRFSMTGAGGLGGLVGGLL